MHLTLRPTALEDRCVNAWIRSALRRVIGEARRSRCVPSVNAGNEPPPDAVSVRPVLGKAEREHGLLEP